MLDNNQLTFLRERLDPMLKILGSDNNIIIPPMWKGYESKDKAERRATLDAEIESLGYYFGETALQLKKVAFDGYLAVSPRLGLCRFFAINIDGYKSWRFSLAPLRYSKRRLSENAQTLIVNGPAILDYVYNEMMDGFTDIYGFVGFINTENLQSAQDAIDVYGEAYYYDELEAKGDLSKMIEIFLSGGGGSIVINLTDNQYSAGIPMAMQLSNDPDDGWNPDREVELFPLLDAWMTVGMGG